ncbi:MAG: hypothetical protein CMH41_10955 [Micrococcales bacterium]|nr:hypothetical protein [Micrococcales bacterium]
MAVVALIVGALALRRVDVVERRARRWLSEPDESAAVSERYVAAGSVQEIAELREEVAALAASTRGLSRVAVVRYDAFEDLGGRLSFSAAVLDDDGRGLVLTTIHGRSETRSYVKEVPAPADGSQHDLSPEEKQAIGNANRMQS